MNIKLHHLEESEPGDVIATPLGGMTDSLVRVDALCCVQSLIGRQAHPDGVPRFGSSILQVIGTVVHPGDLPYYGRHSIGKCVRVDVAFT